VSKELKKHIYLCYSGLGPEMVAFKKFALGYRSKRWLNSTMSPIWIGPRVQSRDLKRIEKWFSNTKQLGPYEGKNYFNALGNGHLTSSSKALLKKQGWGKRKGKSILLYWNRPLNLRLPTNAYWIAGRPTDKQLWPMFAKELVKNFGSSRLFLTELKKLVVDVRHRTQLVLLVRGKRDIIGSGLVTTGNGHAFLWCGSINKKWRSKGFWRQLVAARQLASMTDGAAHWVATTSNSRIMKASRQRFQVISYVKE
jgi:hypothetical protein